MKTKLSAYELKCGKVQQETIDKDHLFSIIIEIYSELNSYHVRAFRVVNNSSSFERLHWSTYDKHNEAQKAYSKLKKELK